MSDKKNTLQQELDKLEVESLKRIAKLWNIQNQTKEKKIFIKYLMQGMQNEFYIKGVLEKLSSTQVSIYSILLNSKDNVVNLGDIARKLSIPPMNTEMELSVLKRYYLVYQRKNRERLTNNLDRYHYYPESGSLVSTEKNEKNKKIKLSLAEVLTDKVITNEWKKVFRQSIKSKTIFNEKIISTLSKGEYLKKAMALWGPIEKEIVQECFYQGGILEMSQVREIVRVHKKPWEFIIQKLHTNGLIVDEYYIDEKFIRILVIPQEVFEYLRRNPLIEKSKKGIQSRQAKKVSNDLDFFLNMKKLIVDISRKGINLAKSDKIKQVELREIEENFIQIDTSLFIEKSQIYQVELLLPIMRLLDIVRIKNQSIVLRNEYESILHTDTYALMKKILRIILEKKDRRYFYENTFIAKDIPFPKKNLWQECLNYIQENERVLFTVIMSSIIRKHLLLSRTLQIKEFPSQLIELRREITSVLFYMQLFGIIEIEYPERWVSISNFGKSFLEKQNLPGKDEKGGIILNPDMSLIAIPEKISLKSMLVLKTFTEIKSFDNVYTMQITKKSFQNAILLKEKPQTLLNTLKDCYSLKLSQNFLFSIKEWSKSFPLVEITDECVLVRTKEPQNMELLVGQLEGKRIIQENVGPNTILIYPSKIPEVIETAEKLELLIRLIR